MAKKSNNTGKPEPKYIEKLQEHGTSLLEHSIRFTAIANAGGIVATITVLSATAKAGDIANILALPLALFATGVICALLVTFETLIHTASKITKINPSKFKIVQWFTPLLVKYQDLLFYGGPICFVAGTVAGVIIVAFV